MIKNRKYLGAYGLFFMVTGVVIAITILYFDYSIIVEIKHSFHPFLSQYTVPLWMSTASAVCINLIGALIALIFIKELNNTGRANKQQVHHQKVTQNESMS